MILTSLDIEGKQTVPRHHRDILSLPLTTDNELNVNNKKLEHQSDE